MNKHLAGLPAGVQGYDRQCRCDDCKMAKAQAFRDYSLRRYRNGGPLMVPIDRARDHILWLRDNGVAFKQIAIITGLDESHVARIAHSRRGSGRRMRRINEAAILSISRQQAADTGDVDAALTWRRLHGLMALGWPSAMLKRELGFSHDRRSVPFGRVRVTARNARSVAELCRRLGLSPGPSESTRLHAERQGWPAYGSWDDDLDELADSTYWRAVGE